MDNKGWTYRINGIDIRSNMVSIEADALINLHWEFTNVLISFFG